MDVRCCCIVAVVLVAGGSAIAQAPSVAADNAACHAQKADVEQRMELARSKGQMLLRRQLAEQLATLQAGCKALPADQSRAANIERLEKEVRALRAQLDIAEEQLRKLKSEASR